MEKAAIDRYFADQEEKLVEAVSRLVRIRSVREEAQPGKPFGPGPAAALDEALKLAEEMGLKPRNHEGYVGTADLNDKETALHILGHLDVVAEGAGWTVTGPYEPRVADGCIYGRGTDDDKGPVVAAMLAMKAVKDLGAPLNANVRLIMGTDEESGSEDIEYYFARNPYAKYTFTPDSGFPVINTEKGGYKPTFSKHWEKTDETPRVTSFHGGFRINVLPGDAEATVKGMTAEELKPYCDKATASTDVKFTLTGTAEGTIVAAKGKGSHAAEPEEARNAITGLLVLLCSLPLCDCGSTRTLRDLNALLPHGDYLGRALGIAQEDETSGYLTLSFTLLELDEEGAEGRFDSRVPICATRENCAAVVERAFAEKGFACTGEMNAPHHTPAEGEFVSTLLRRYEEFTGNKGECLAIGGGTYVHDIPGGVAFGCFMPGFVTNLHGPDERSRISDLMTSAKIFTAVILDLCS